MDFLCSYFPYAKEYSAKYNKVEIIVPKNIDNVISNSKYNFDKKTPIKTIKTIKLSN